MDSKHLCFIVGIIIFALSCKSAEKKKYIYFGHTYQSNSSVDERIQALDLKPYDQVWLGGDLCSETTQDKTAIDHLETVFGISSPTTHWSLGNHDIRNGHVDWITSITKRPTFYATSFDGLTLLLLNTNLKAHQDSAKIQAQFRLIKNVCDTIANSSHLIVLTHHVVWEGIDSLSDANEYANGKLTSFPFRLSPTKNYRQIIYPMFLEVQKRGVQVIHVSGDLGQKKVNTFAYKTKDGIQFLGSGILAKTKYNRRFPSYDLPSYYLEFTHNIRSQKITWEFKELPAIGK